MKIFVSLLLLLFLPLISYAQNNLYLCLLDKNGKILFKTEINQNSQFGIRFIHSVAKTPVEDWFSVQNGHIYLEKTIYHDFGAGLPYKPDQNQNMKFTDDEIIISGYHTKLSQFDQLVGHIANHTLLLPQSDKTIAEIPLNKLAKPGQSITFIIKKI